MLLQQGSISPQVYDDLRNPLCESALALVHQRFSTNTFPSWSLAQPFRLICREYGSAMSYTEFVGAGAILKSLALVLLLVAAATLTTPVTVPNRSSHATSDSG